nr:paired amphipathic helix protein sin3-like 3 [Quercus suber]
MVGPIIIMGGTRGGGGEFERAIELVNKRFEHDRDVYKQMLDVLSMFRDGRAGKNLIAEQIIVLFHDHPDHPDLISDFSNFLSDG